MAKNYAFNFGSTTLSATSGLAPTFIHFVRLDTGTTLAPPGITQIIAGIGIYKFAYTPSFPIFFQIDGATTGLASRFITGMLDGIDQIDDLLAQQGGTLQAVGSTLLQSQVNIGSTLVGIGNTVAGIGNTVLGTSGLAIAIANLVAAVGSTASAIGDSVTDPATLYGFLKRSQETQEGDSSYTKATGVWTITNRAGTTTLATKTLTDSSGIVTKT